MPMIGTAHRTTANGTTIAWSELGAGAPLVLVHGIGASHRTFRLLAPALAEHFHVYMLDLPGHGLSERPEAPYTLPWYADTVAAWMDAIGLPSAHFCGHSFGGGVAQWMLVDHAERVDRLALLAAGGLGREVTAALRLASTPLAAPLLESRLFGTVIKHAMRWVSRRLDPAEHDEIERLARLSAVPNSGRAFRRTVSGCIGLRGQRVQTWDHISKIPSLPPLAVFWGGRDEVIPVEHAHETARRIENLALTIYPDCGHFPHLQEAERLARDVTRFFLDPE
ncbi:MAG TPA: alpha/beta fold hydrolase, partial [Polyangiaceae bacterium]|nr:alpha/beta fold hydrolase [Polyangiaceae bacterium]